MKLPLHYFCMRLALILAALLIPTTARSQIEPAHTAAESAGQTLKFKVLVLDALDGKPQIGVEVTSFCEGAGYIPHNEVRSGSDGVAEVVYQCKEGTEQITVDVPSEAKGECGGLGTLKLSDILTKGIISEPNGAGGYWCPTKQRRKLKPVPGQVTIFVKKPTWWQSHVAS